VLARKQLVAGQIGDRARSTARPVGELRLHQV